MVQRRFSRPAPSSLCAQSCSLQPPLLCAENILPRRDRRHKGRATGRMQQVVQLPLQGPSRASCDKCESDLHEGGETGAIPAGSFSSIFCAPPPRTRKDELKVLLFPKPTLKTKKHHAGLVTSHVMFRKGTLTKGLQP